MADLLLELFSEEIPARMQADAIAHLSQAVSDLMRKNGMQETLALESFVTPRRLTVIIRNLPLQTADISEELKGPKVDAPAAALDGFLRKTGLEKEQLEVRTVGKDQVYFAVFQKKGQALAEILKAGIEDIMRNFSWPKSMRWGSGEQRWVRPLHSMICLFDGNIIPVEFAGVTAGNTTYGHRFLAPQTITISDPAQYESTLEKAFVIAKRNARKHAIQQQINAIAAAQQFSVKPDEALLEEVVGLVEFPFALLGTIDAKFMDLPVEVLTTVMRSHQKYFALTKADGSMSDRFITISNMNASAMADRGAAIIAGNERVLRARFSDARFFWDLDRKAKMEDWAKSLSGVTYHAKLGSVADKVARIEKLALKLAEYVPGADKNLVTRAAALCKADLVSGMVGEFAELQGIMGRYYALAAGEDAHVADAIRDHYKPQGPNDVVPLQTTAIIIALADKLDTLISMFAIGEKPTGSKDPFALRRAALGIIRIVLENGLRLPLKNLFAFAPLREIATHKAHEKLIKQTEASLDEPHKVGKYLTISETAHEEIPEDRTERIVSELLAFFHDRLKIMLKEDGMRHDIVSAVLTAKDDDFLRIRARAIALKAFLGTEDGTNMLAGYKRAVNILSIEEKKDKTAYAPAGINAGLLKEATEKALHEALVSLQRESAALLAKEDYTALMQKVAALRPAVDAFFEAVMVNAPEADIRQNRLSLMALIREALRGVADFGLLEG